MRYSMVYRILGILLMLFSLTMLPPVAISLGYGDEAEHAFLVAFAITLLSGGALLLVARGRARELRTRDGFLVTALFWVVLGLYGALPFAIATDPHLSISDAVFESVSGLTTTGATVMQGLDELPRSILYYRQQLQWLGGIGIIVIAVAVLPMLGIGGMQLYRAETPGPVKENKLTPRITGTAKALFIIYVSLTLVCALAYDLAGMDTFDAITHSYATVAIGGFSTHDASMAYFDSPLILSVCIVFMMLAALNFALHYVSWRQRTAMLYFTDPESRFFLLMLAIASGLTVAILFATRHFDFGEGLLHGLFQVVSIATTTGFTTVNYAEWPSVLPFMLLFFAFMGGCAGSTAGGIKVIRVLLICKQGVRELKQLVHPNALLPVKLGKRTVPDRIIIAVWSFFAVYVITFMVILLALLAHDMDFVTAFSAVAATLNNLGPGLGEVAAHYGGLDPLAKWILCFSMLLGRLEIFTLLVLFTPEFWRN